MKNTSWSRSSLSARERSRRSRLAQIVSRQPFLRGTLAVRRRRCGKANCRCADGELHGSLYLVQSRGGKPRQVFVPKEWEERIRQNVQGYQEIQQLLEELSEVEWQRLLDRRESPRSPTSD
jgi:hypothetical protein